MKIKGCFVLILVLLLNTLFTSLNAQSEKNYLGVPIVSNNISSNEKFILRLVDVPDFSGEAFYLYNKQNILIDTNIYRHFVDMGEVVLVKSLEGLYAVFTPDGAMLHPPSFPGITNFGCGVFGVHNGEYYGYMNTKGEMVIPFQFKVATQCNGTTIAAVDSLGQWDLYLPNGMRVTNGQFAEIYNDSKGEIIAFKEKGTWMIGFMNKLGEPILKPQFTNFAKQSHTEFWRVEKDKKWGVIDGSGKVLHDFIYDDIAFKKDKVFEGIIGDKTTIIDLR